MWIIFPRMTLGVIIHVGVYCLAQGQGTRTLSPGALSGCFGTGLTAFHLYNSTFIALSSILYFQANQYVEYVANLCLPYEITC